MDLYITFYNIVNKHVYIHNGFSFGREKKPDDIDVFVDILKAHNIKTYIDFYKPEKIWCSLSYGGNFKFINIINQISDERWIIGGPFIVSNKGNKKFIDSFSNKPTYIYTTMEEYLGKPLSSDFDPYFLDFIEKNFSNRNIHYNLSLGNTCYWNKCTFCWFKNLYSYKRTNIKKLVESAIPSIYGNNSYITHTCISSPTPEMLKIMIESNNNSARFDTFIRSDKSILNQLIQYDDLSQYVFVIGVEGFSQGIIDELNKGFEIDIMMQIIEEVIKRKGTIGLSFMSNYSFLTKKIVEECKNNIDKLENLYIKYKNIGIAGKSGNPVVWSNQYEAEKYGFKSQKLEYPISRIDNYCTILPHDSEQLKFNNEILDHLKKTTIPSHIS